MTDSQNPYAPARDSEEPIPDEALSQNVVGTSNIAVNAFLLVGILACLYGFYGITKYALGFLFPQSAAFFRLMVAFIAMHALVVTAGVGLIAIAQRVKEGHKKPDLTIFMLWVGLPCIGAFGFWVVAQLAIIPSLRS